MIEKIWNDRGKFNTNKVMSLSKALNICPEVIAILDKRGIEPETFFSFSPVPNSFLIKDLEKGVDMAASFCKRRAKIAVVNDYDVDGATSGIIMKETLKAAGGDVVILTPKRNIDGYGISKRIVDLALEEGAELIVTTDNGISAFESIEYAKSMNLTVIVTDHHDVHKDEQGRDVLPAADVVIDVKRQDCDYPFKDICGAEVALKFACVLFSKTGLDDMSRKKLFRRFVELASIGTICDVMPLVEENRTLVIKGLEYLKASQIIGIRQLIKTQSLEPEKITATSVGFQLGPCFNAMSRIYDDTAPVLSLLEEKDHIKALKLAETLSKANEERKAISEKAKKEGFEKLNPSQPVSIIYVPGSNPSLMGIAAGKIKDETGHPTVCLTDAGEGILKGSGRSTEDYNMFENFSKYEEFYESFGGHPGAVGLSIKSSELDKWTELINTDAKGYVFRKKTVVDLYLPMKNVTNKLIEDISRMEPFGEGNPAPVLCDDTCSLIKLSRMGKEGQYIRLGLLNDRGEQINAVYFGDAGEFDKYIMEYVGIPTKEKLYNGEAGVSVPINFLYTPKFNEWNGEVNISLVIKDYLLRK